MACILHIETSTRTCSVAVSQEGAVIFRQEMPECESHDVHLSQMVEEAVSFTDSHAIPFDAVAVSAGPGSYTGLRIGASVAKGFCYARRLPLIAVDTLQVLCVPVLLQHDDLPDEALLCPMLDARRMEVYTALYTRALREVQPVGAMVITADSFADILAQRPVYFFGNGAAKCNPLLTHANAHFLDGFEPLARWMSPLAERALLRGEFADAAYFEPNYLKEFVAIKSKKNLL